MTAVHGNKIRESFRIRQEAEEKRLREKEKKETDDVRQGIGEEIIRR